ncbi:MAG: sulfatase [Planctomycetes bacterium]|nr:sulfatase [Planctomycetota bacterium]
MGERFDADAPPLVALHVAGTAPIATVSYCVDGVIRSTVDVEGARTQLDLEYQVEQSAPGEHWVYALIAQHDGNRAWTSPLWFTIPEAEPPVLPTSISSIQDDRESPARDPKRPNIVLIVADDLGWRDLSCQGSSYYETPNIDRLASQGMRFTNAYANGPNCAPTRASLMTGMYTPRHGIYTVGSSKRGQSRFRKLVPTVNKTELADESITLPEVLKTRGYRTGLFGKWHLGDDPRTQGFDVNVGGTSKGHPSSYTSPYQNKALTDGEDGEYLTDRLTSEACAFVRKNAHRPFFCYLPYYAVHTPIQPKAGTAAKYRNKKASDGQSNARYAAMIATLDENVGRVLATLDEAGIADDTIVIFVSDNGGVARITSNQPLRGGKGMLYEGGIRVPWIVRYPGVAKAGTTNDTPVITSDLLATVAALAGVAEKDVPKTDGIDLGPVLRGGSIDPRILAWHFPAYLEADAKQGTWRSTPASALRHGRYKLLHFFEDGRLELYDLENDVSESIDIAQREPGIVVDLEAMLAKWRLDLDAPIPFEREPDYGK